MLTLVLTLLLGWIAMSIPVTLGVARGARIAADREGERRAAPVAQLRTSGLDPISRAA